MNPFPWDSISNSLQFLGSISFPIFVVHGPLGQLFYKKAVATAVWGQNMASPQPVGIHWFFLVYWCTVLTCAYILQKVRIGLLMPRTIKG
eukprot:Skav228704  [mRNA]  locus=scaffold3376:28428:31988:- [translate_table: standard]